MPKDRPASAQSPSQLIDARIADLDDWRGDTLARIRTLIKQADPGVVEEWKWRGVPVWSHDGIICTGETYKNVVKLTFFKGAALNDPAGLFNAGLDGNVRRAIDLHEGDRLNARAFKSLVRAAGALNASSRGGTGKGRPKEAAAKPPPAVTKGARAPKTAQPELLAGGNPRIAKGDGDAPIQAYIAAMPGWKRNVGRDLDALIGRTVPNVRKAVKWNSPFYGVDGQGWFLSFHCYTKYIKVTFFAGASLDPAPPVPSKDDAVRYFHIHEGDRLDGDLLTRWIRQASAIPGWVP